MKGSFVVNPKYAEAQTFTEGLAGVCQGKKDKYGNGLKCGYVNVKGVEAIPLQFDEVGYFRNGVSSFGSGDINSDYEGRKYGYLDRSGKILINPEFAFAGEYADGLALVKIGLGEVTRYGYIS